MFGWGGAMNQNRRLRLWQLLVEHADGRPVTVGHVGTVVLATAGVDRAAVTVVLAAMSRQPLATSGPAGPSGCRPLQP